ncbi:MAG: hypothetical protein H6Q65_2099 [Firmicutes bacterium]|nr:hypothetical protein [Bacillota bacterium]
MGSSYGICCKECDYAKSFKVGIGMMYSPLNLMEANSEFALLPSLIRSKKTVKYIGILLMDKRAVIADDYRHAVYRCPQCGEFYERFFIHLDYDNGSFEVEYKCTKCKAKLELIEHEIVTDEGWKEREIDLQRYPCPRCGKNGLYEDGSLMIMWD